MGARFADLTGGTDAGGQVRPPYDLEAWMTWLTFVLAAILVIHGVLPPQANKPAPVSGSSDAALRNAVEQFISREEPGYISEFIQLLSIPNVSSDRANIRRNADFLQQMLQRRGMKSEILQTAGNPLVYGELESPAATRTILFYIHYDGQPVDPSLWKQSSPFQPVLRTGRMEDGAAAITNLSQVRKFEPDWRLYARSASDDKAPIEALCVALDALKANGRNPAGNIRIILDGEEEAGSPSLTAAVARYRDKLKSDLLLVLDGPTHPSGGPTVVFGGRGILDVDLTVYGPRFALHSGHYGNWIPNPAMRLAQLLASIKDERGHVMIEGFYDGIPALTDQDRRAMNAVPDDLPGLRRFFGVAETEEPGRTLQQALQYPSFNVRGLSSGYTGPQARTIIPSEATAAVDIRLVKETPARQTLQKLLAHIRRQGYHIVEQPPDDATRLRYPMIVRVQPRGEGTEAYRTSMDLPVSKAVTSAVAGMWGREVVQIRTMGGTVPISQFIQLLGVPAIAIPIVNFDNNQHSENENLRLGNLREGIVTFAALLSMK
ncbi:MAG TPA: M20/M25/M40 family metallo-hydrolase [Acidobacteriota bacterium]|jgi:acetylornithine deacetylase/succinyl-diaminopimelate desuccinylase-like protein